MAKSIKVLSRPEINVIHTKLKRGKKRELAKYLGLAPSALSRYLNEGKCGFRMPLTIYEKILEFMNIKNNVHGVILSTEIQKEK